MSLTFGITKKGLKNLGGDKEFVTETKSRLTLE